MLEPMPEHFGLRVVSSDKYELVGVNEPQPSDFGLDNSKPLRFITEEKYDNIFWGLPILIFAALIIYNHKFVIETISSGFVIACVFLFMSGFGFLFIVSFSDYMVGIIHACEKYFVEHYSQQYKYYCKYMDLRKKYLSDLYSAINKFENDKRAYAIYRETEMKKQTEQIECEMRKLKNYWFSLDGRTFEGEMCKVFRKKGYGAKLTPVTNDHGIDIVLTKNNKKSLSSANNITSQLVPML